MTPNLRKRHRAIWVVWAICLPILFVLAIWSIPETVIEEDAIPAIEHIQPSETPSDSIQS